MTSNGTTETDMKLRIVVPSAQKPTPFYDEYDKRLIDEFANESGKSGFDEVL